mmetsp:Transcript_26999/g.59523  ORF Transcript_26999/g.59523 Transcript_26999/m.59523 type:complete len:319 (+) Transcript_26999:1755-2711(+)
MGVHRRRGSIACGSFVPAKRERASASGCGFRENHPGRFRRKPEDSSREARSWALRGVPPGHRWFPGATGRPEREREANRDPCSGGFRRVSGRPRRGCKTRALAPRAPESRRKRSSTPGIQRSRPSSWPSAGTGRQPRSSIPSTPCRCSSCKDPGGKKRLPSAPGPGCRPGPFRAGKGSRNIDRGPRLSGSPAKRKPPHRARRKEGSRALPEPTPSPLGRWFLRLRLRRPVAEKKESMRQRHRCALRNHSGPPGGTRWRCTRAGPSATSIRGIEREWCQDSVGRKRRARWGFVSFRCGPEPPPPLLLSCGGHGNQTTPF